MKKLVVSMFLMFSFSTYGSVDQNSMPDTGSTGKVDKYSEVLADIVPEAGVTTPLGELKRPGSDSRYRRVKPKFKKTLINLSRKECVDLKNNILISHKGFDEIGEQYKRDRALELCSKITDYRNSTCVKLTNRVFHRPSKSKKYCDYGAVGETYSPESIQ